MSNARKPIASQRQGTDLIVQPKPPWNNKKVLGHDEQDNRKDTGKTSDSMFVRVAKTKTKTNLRSIDPEEVLRISEDGEFHDKIGTIEQDKIQNKGGDKRDENKERDDVLKRVQKYANELERKRRIQQSRERVEELKK